jgi:colanic acid biosynthesis glycosyl transferase WcaI
VPLRIVIHDYSGHPFQVQLSRELARRGHAVLHLHCPSYRSGKGALEPKPGDPPGFSVEPISLDRPFDKYSPVRRLRQERAYGRRLVRRIHEERPDVVLSSNTPLFAQQIVISKLGLPFVFWQQDVYSVAMKREVERRLPFLGGLVGRRFVELERRLLERSHAVVTIAEDFKTTLLEWGLPPDKVHVIENWAPLEELPAGPRDNEWARRHDLAGKRVLLYSGTLGLKHDPGLLLQLADAFRGDPDVRVVVVAEGPGAESLEPAGNMLVLGFQPYEALPEVLATADVLLVLLEHEAGRFAVPSKVLTYLCSARPLLAALPRENLAASVVERAGAGLLVNSDDVEGLVAGARRLLAEPELSARMGASAREYAEATFAIGPIADRFEEVLGSVVHGS